MGALLLAIVVVLGAVSDDAVVGRAGEITITVGRLKAYAETRPDVPPKTLVRELIEFELLAAEAKRQGLTTDSEVQGATNKALVRMYLKREFEPKFAKDTLPEADARESYRRNRGFFVHPELREGGHMLVAVKATEKSRPTRPSDPQLDAKAHALADKIHESLVDAELKDTQAFLEASDAFQDEAKALGLVLLPERLSRFAEKGRMDPAFSEAAFKVAAKTPSPPVASAFGWHVIWIETIEPAINRSFEEVEDELRERIVPEVRQQAITDLTKRLANKHNALINPDPLEQLEERRGIDPRSLTPQSN